MCLSILEAGAEFLPNLAAGADFLVGRCAMLSRATPETPSWFEPRESMSPRAAYMLSRGWEGVMISAAARESMAHPWRLASKIGRARRLTWRPEAR